MGEQYVQAFPELAHDASAQLARPHSDAESKETLGRRGPNRCALSIHSNKGPRAKILWNGTMRKVLVFIIGVQISEDERGGFLLSMHTVRKDGMNSSIIAV